MVYSQAWSNAIPLGTDAAKTADNQLRDLRRDIEERMATICTGWSTGAPTDPIVMKPAPGVLNVGDIDIKSTTGNVRFYTNNVLSAQSLIGGDFAIQGGLRVGNSSGAGAVLGARVNRIEIFAVDGTSLGFIPIYASA